MAKTVYDHLFQFLVKKINLTYPEPTTMKQIAILDIPGFGMFSEKTSDVILLKFLTTIYYLEIITECHLMGRNSFEQLCINFVNEKVQHFCASRLIKEELDWYASEGVLVRKIEFLDNDNILGILLNSAELILI